MRLVWLGVIVVSFAVSAWGQAPGVKIRSNSSTADSSAIIEVESTSKGLLVPRMSESTSPLSQSQRDSLKKVVQEVKTRLSEAEAKALAATATVAELNTTLAAYALKCTECAQVKALQTALKSTPPKTSTK